MQDRLVPLKINTAMRACLLYVYKYEKYAPLVQITPLRKGIRNSSFKLPPSVGPGPHHYPLEERDGSPWKDRFHPQGRGYHYESERFVGHHSSNPSTGSDGS